MSGFSARITAFLSAQGWPATLRRCLVIILVGIAAYSNTFFSTFNFDDTKNILANPRLMHFPHVDPLKFLKASRLVGDLTFLLNYRLHGSSVFGYHLLNLAIHLSAALLVYALITQVFLTPYAVAARRDTAGQQPLPPAALALCAALLFVAHPLQTQAVTYIVQRFTSLATLFYLAALVAYGRARLSQTTPAGSHRRLRSTRWYLFSFLAAILAMRTKEIAYTLPLAILLYEFLFFPGGGRRRLAVLLLFMATMVIIPLGVLGVNRPLRDLVASLDYLSRVQTSMPRLDYLFTQLRVIVTYLRLLLLPVNQSLEHAQPVFNSFFQPQVFASFLLLSALLLVGGYLAFRSRPAAGWALHARLVAFGIFWFFITLSVESSINPIVDLIFEHRVYLPSVGAAVAVTAGAFGAAGARAALRPRLAMLLYLIIICVTLALAGATFKRNLVWRDEVTLWSDATAKSPTLSRPWNNLGFAYLKRSEPYKAIPPLIRSIELDPSRPDAWNNLGLALEQTGRFGGRFRKTVELFEDQGAVPPGVMQAWFGKAYNSLGLAYELQGRPREALQYYQKAIGMYPAQGEAYFNLGLLFLAAGDRQRATMQYQLLSMVDPGLARLLLARIAGDDKPQPGSHGKEREKS